MNLKEFITTSHDSDNNALYHEGNIDLGDGRLITEFPKRLNVGGTLNLDNTKIKYFEEYLTCFSLSMKNTPLVGSANSPMHYISCSEADFSNSEIKRLPLYFRCPSITLENCKNFTNLNADHFTHFCKEHSGVSVFAKNSGIKTVYMRYRKRLTEDKNERDFYYKTLELRNCPISELPNDLVVVNLYISNTNITELPKSAIVKSDLDISNTKFTSLPDNLSLIGSLNVSNTKLTTLPKGLYVQGDLICKGMEHLKVPSGTVIKGRIIAK